MTTDDTRAPPRGRAPFSLKRLALTATILAVAVVGWGLFARSRDQAATAKTTVEQAIPTIAVIFPASGPSVRTLTLPGTLQAYFSAAVYARVPGYLKRWLVDIGAPVKSGQLLAEIETPELDQQLKQSEANLETALANERLTEITNRRWQHLLSSDAVSQQEADEKMGDQEAKQALVDAARADVERLRALESFKRITAPFDGVVTARKTDVGALINAGHEPGHELFTVADVRKLRLYVEVPQSYATAIRTGMHAQLEVPERPGQRFSAVLTDNSGSVGANSGAVLIELQVDNAQRTLMPGGYGTVHLDLPRDMQAVQVPASALVFRREGLRVALLNSDNRVAFRSIQISRDLGAVVEVASGLSSSDRIINNPPDSLEEGDVVRVASAENRPLGGNR